MAEEIRIKFATFKLCSCSFSNQVHLQVVYKIVALDYGNAVAISYTWGEFNRQKVTIGHDESDTEVKMNLGQEWPINDVVQALARICREHARGNGCCMDQLCIPQDDAVERRKMIMQIPNVFRTFRVAILLCGKPCRCFNTTAALSIARNRTGIKALDPVIKAVGDKQRRDCWDSLGISSYFQRLWTRQEFRYGTEISVVWCSTAARPCVRSDPESNSLSLYAQLVLKHDESWKLPLNRKTREFITSCCQAIAIWPGSVAENPNDHWGGLWESYTLLAGYPMKRKAHSHLFHEEVRLYRFLADLLELSHATGCCSATEPCDYVAAVWVDCPKYELPHDYKSRGLPSLLEDAIRQLAVKHGLSLAVSFPSDLSTGGHTPGGGWQPITYRAEIEVRSSNDVYAPILPAQPLRLSRPRFDEMQLFAIDEVLDSKTSLGLAAEKYPSLYGRKNAYNMIFELMEVVAHWKPAPRKDIFSRFQRAPEKAMVDAFSTAMAPKLRYSILYEGLYILNMDKVDAGDVEHFSSLLGDDFDCYAFAFGFLCLALGVDAMVARKRGLTLVITETEPKHIGLKLNFPPDAVQSNNMSAESPVRKHITFGGSQETRISHGRRLCDVEYMRSTDGGTGWLIDVMWAHTPGSTMEFSQVPYISRATGRLVLPKQ